MLITPGHFCLGAGLLIFVFIFTHYNTYGTSKTQQVHPLIYELEEEEFQPFISKHDPVMIMFYSPHCGHCHKMKPEFEKLPETLDQMETKAYIARVDGSENKNLLSEQQVEGFPTIKLYTQDEVFDYKGERTSEAMSNWIKKVTGPVLQMIANEKNASGEPNEGYFVGYFQDQESSLYKQFNRVVTMNRLLSSFFAVVPSEKDRIFAFKEDNEKIEYTGENEVELEEFVQAEAFPKLGVISPGNFEKFLNRNLDFGWFEATTKDYKKYGESIRKASVNFKTSLSFVWIDSELYSSKDNDDSSPSFMLNLLNGTRYELKDAATSLSDPEVITNFLKDAQAGKIPPFLKSEQIPEINDEAVKVFVSKNLMEEAFQPDKDVMIEVYAPWCGHCKQFEPVYNEVADYFKDDPSVVIGKIDGSANESPSPKFDWHGFPTIFFVKAGDESPIPYNGDRKKDAIIQFIKEKGSQKNSNEKSSAPNDNTEL